MKFWSLLIFTALMMLSFTESKAQAGTTGIGIRIGSSQGLSIKHFTGNSTALEGILAARWNGFYFAGLFEKHATAFDVKGLYWFYGGGGHIAAWDDKEGPPWKNEDRYDGGAVIGLDGIVGIEYYVGDIPFSFGVDWKPAFNLVGDFGLWISEGALTIRFVF